LAAAVMSLLVPFGWADPMSISLSTGSNTPTVVATSSTGYVSFTNSFATFTFNNANGTGSPILAEPNLLTNSIDVSSSTGGVLNVFITESGLTTPTGSNLFQSGFTSNTFSGGALSVLEQTFIDVTNSDPSQAGWAGQLLASQLFTGTGSQDSINLSPNVGAGPYSETAEFTITFAGSGSVNDSINLNQAPDPAPEPSVALLLGSGLLGLAGIRRRLKNS
jgi:hypothetical protein